MLPIGALSAVHADNAAVSASSTTSATTISRRVTVAGAVRRYAARGHGLGLPGKAPPRIVQAEHHATALVANFKILQRV